MTGKDILEFPLEELGVPQAIVLMMQAASRCVEPPAQDVNNERLQLLAEKLEARVEEAIEDAKGGPDAPPLEDEPNPFEPVDGHQMHLVKENDVIKQVVVDGVLYVLACNVRVTSSDERPPTFCIKQWNHQAEHTDMEGNFRR